MGGAAENYAEQVQMLSIHSEKCEKRLQTLEDIVVPPTSTNNNSVINRMSIDTAASVHSITDSILSLYGHESLYETPSESQGEVLAPGSMQARVSRIIEDHIRKIAVVDEDEAIEDLKIEQFCNHLAATELFTDFGLEVLHL